MVKKRFVFESGKWLVEPDKPFIISISFTHKDSPLHLWTRFGDIHSLFLRFRPISLYGLKKGFTLQRQLKAFITQWHKLYGQLYGTVGAFNQFTTIHQTTVFPVIQQICDLDGTINADEYDLSCKPPLQAPKPIEDPVTNVDAS